MDGSIVDRGHWGGRCRRLYFRSNLDRVRSISHYFLKFYSNTEVVPTGSTILVIRQLPSRIEDFHMTMLVFTSHDGVD